MKVFQHLFSELVPQLPNIAMYCISQRNLAIQWKYVGIHVFKLSPTNTKTCCLLIFGIVGFHLMSQQKVDQTTDRKSVILSHQPTTYRLQNTWIMVPSLLQIFESPSVENTLRHLLEPAQARTYLTARIRCYVRTSAVIAWLGELSFRMAWSSTGWWI